MKLHMICTAVILGSGLAQAQFTSLAPAKNRSTAPIATPQQGGGSFSGGGADCATAVAVGTGPTAANFPFDNTVAASMGVVTNPFELICNFSGQLGIDNEEWFSWIAMTDGIARLDTCSGLGGVDTKVAIYANDCANILTLDPIACKDDNPACGPNFEATVTWPIAAGTTYLIQLGTFTTAPGGASDFSIEELPANPPGQHDLGASQNALGLAAGGDMIWMNVFDSGGGTTVSAIEVVFGTTGGVAPPDGSPATVAVYQGDPVNGLSFITSESTVSANSNTDMFVSVPLTSPAAVVGNYTIAVSMPHLAGEFPAAMDHTVNSLGRAWIAGDAAAVDIMDPTAGSVPLAELQAIQPANFDAVWLLRADVSGGGPVFPESCNGDGGNQMGCTDCPCGNNAAPGTTGGCLNSANASGRLVGSGSPSVTAADPADLRFDANGCVPSSFAVLTSGNAIAPANAANPCFGEDSGLQSGVLDGLRCAVQSTQRHGGRPVDANGDVGATTNGWGGSSGPPIGLAAQGGFVAGQTRHYQVFYRELPGLVCLTEQNTTQAVSVTFQP